MLLMSFCLFVYLSFFTYQTVKHLQAISLRTLIQNAKQSVKCVLQKLQSTTSQFNQTADRHAGQPITTG